MHLNIFNENEIYRMFQGSKCNKRILKVSSLNIYYVDLKPHDKMCRSWSSLPDHKSHVSAVRYVVKNASAFIGCCFPTFNGAWPDIISV